MDCYCHVPPPHTYTDVFQGHFLLVLSQLRITGAGPKSLPICMGMNVTKIIIKESKVTLENNNPWTKLFTVLTSARWDNSSVTGYPHHHLQLSDGSFGSFYWLVQLGAYELIQESQIHGVKIKGQNFILTTSHSIQVSYYMMEKWASAIFIRVHGRCCATRFVIRFESSFN